MMLGVIVQWFVVAPPALVYVLLMLIALFIFAAVLPIILIFLGVVLASVLANSFKLDFQDMIFESLSSHAVAAILIWPVLRGDWLLALIAISVSGFGASYLLALLQKKHPASRLERSLWAVVAAVTLNLAPWIIAGR